MNDLCEERQALASTLCAVKKMVGQGGGLEDLARWLDKISTSPFQQVDIFTYIVLLMIFSFYP